jgi:RNase P protein component
MRPGQDVVVIARPSSALASNVELEEAVHAALRKTGSVRPVPEVTHA